VQILKELKSAEAITVIKKYAELNPLFKDRAEETIEYLKNTLSTMLMNQLLVGATKGEIMVRKILAAL
jgi:hypothetical protein